MKHFLKPKKLRVKLHFGFEDPYHTGQVLALCGMFYAFIGENMDLEPDFEKAGTGRFRLCKRKTKNSSYGSICSKDAAG